MNEELTSTELIVLPLEEQISNELVKGNVTQAVITDLKERYLPLKIAGIDDKETYLIIKEGRKECKSIRVMASKICKKGREDAVAIQKAWVAKEKEVTDQIAEVEDYLEKQEKDYEAEVAKEKEARKRKQEEQLILRQQALTNMGALYSDGSFTLGEVSFELSIIKESEEDIWQETIFPKFYEEYNKIELDRMAKERERQEREAELKRQQEALEQKQKELADKEAELKIEAERQEREAETRRKEKIKTRTDYLVSLGLSVKQDGDYVGHGLGITAVDIEKNDDEEWSKLMDTVAAHVEESKAFEANEKRVKQERADLQSKRLSELLPFNPYGADVDMATLGWLTEDQYGDIFSKKKREFEEDQERERQRISENATKKERERIEEEQRQAEVKRKDDLRRDRTRMLVSGDLIYKGEYGYLGEMPEEEWMKVFNELKSEREESIRKQEEERKAEMFAQASDKTKWADLIAKLDAIEIHDFRSGQYRKKAAILREKLEEIQAL